MRTSVVILAVAGLLCWQLGCDDTVETSPPTGGSGGTGGSSTIGGGGAGGSTGSGTGGSTSSGTGGTGGSTSSGTGGSTSSGTGGAPSGDKVDLLLVVDNSRSMADKQNVLASSVPEVIGTFANPRCVDGNGVPAAAQPSSPAEPCAAGYQRRFAPVTDMHVGVISTSLGGHGADACDALAIPSENDDAHLIDRLDPMGSGTVPTYQGLHFLAWDPAQQLSPPGEASAANLASSLSAMIIGAGEVGCGYEAQLESWYRFLIDPNPYESIGIVSGSAVLNGTDQVLLAQRNDFLRSDSLLVIVLLSDENDCSTRDGGQFFFVNQIYQPGSTTPYHLPRPQITCATDPTSPCCRSCGQSVAAGCPPKGPECDGALPPLDDQINVRCWEQKRRFGIDFMWPIGRYVTGLTATVVQDRDGNLVPNPLFIDPNGRDNTMVRLVGIVGVPWQDIARQDSSGNPDLLAGLDGDGHAVGGLRSAAELLAGGIWPIILGEPDQWINATDPLMIESQNPRSGTNPITGDAIAPPGAASFQNPINGHEYSIPQKNDLQYACIFPLPAPRDCSNPSQIACDCLDPSNDSPLCQNPVSNAFGVIQYNAKAHPGRRELQLLRDLGSEAVVGSICPAQLANSSAADYGYLPVLHALGESASRSLVQP